MLIQTSCPLDYSLCNQTVTVYRLQGETVLRQVVQGCYFESRTERKTDALGSRTDFGFLLVTPGPEQRVFPGDRVMPGVGPEIEPEQWAGFIPAEMPGLYEAAYAAPYRWDGKLCHVEAGRK